MSGEALRQVLETWANPPATMVDKLPKPTRKDNAKGSCRECGGYHGLPAVHLDYMGHASVTRALIEIDPERNWEPVAFTEGGEPLIGKTDRHLRLWARLTVLGKSVLCVGTCDAGKPEPEKELIGDMLRNGAMRLGIGLSLWAKDEWNDLGTSDSSGTQSRSVSGAAAGQGGGGERAAKVAAPPSPPVSSEQGTAASSDMGDGPTAGDGPSPTDVVERIRKLDQDVRADVRAYAQSKGYTVASLTVAQAADLAAWLDRREKAAAS